MTNNTLTTLAIACSFLTLSCSSSKQADLIVHNALVYTVDSAFSTADAFAVRDGKFISIGSSAEILAAYDTPTIIDAQGQPIYPGFYDAHAHFFGYAQTLGQADLTGAVSFEEVVERLKVFRNEFADAPWLIGRGWDQNLWETKAFPDRRLLDEVFPDIPVYLIRVDGHAALANGKALELAKITGPRTINGGLVETKNGRPTGILVDNAMSLVASAIPSVTAGVSAL